MGARTGQDAQHFWTNFGCMPRTVPLRKPRHPARHVDAELVHGPAGAGVRGRGGSARACPARKCSSARPKRVPAGSDGLLTVLDWLAPTDQPFRKGVMLGFDARHTRGHVYRSILEAIALDHARSRRCDVRRARHHAATRSSFPEAAPAVRSSCRFSRTRSAFPLPARTGPSGASLGAAICAAVAHGRVPGFRRGRRAHGKTAAGFRPAARHRRDCTGA